MRKVILGSSTLFTGLNERIRLKLSGTMTFRCGVVLPRYGPDR